MRRTGSDLDAYEHSDKKKFASDPRQDIVFRVLLLSVLAQFVLCGSSVSCLAKDSDADRSAEVLMPSQASKMDIIVIFAGKNGSKKRQFELEMHDEKFGSFLSENGVVKDIVEPQPITPEFFRRVQVATKKELENFSFHPELEKTGDIEIEIRWQFGQPSRTQLSMERVTSWPRLQKENPALVKLCKRYFKLRPDEDSAD